MTSYVLDNDERVTVVFASEHHVDVEIEYPPGSHAPPHHIHPRQSVRLEVLEGSVHVMCHHDESVLAVGSVFDIPVGVPHRMWNPGEQPARAIWRIVPPGRTLEWFAAISGIERRRGRRDLAAYLVALREFDDVYRYDLHPHFLAQVTVAALAPVSKLWLRARAS